ncbi:MAG: ABC transporter ATP-binding protein [Thermoanaerobaculia bacterium]
MGAPAEVIAAGAPPTAPSNWSPEPEPVATAPQLARPPVVQFKNVTKKFRRGRTWSTAIEDVSFVVDDLPDVGEFVTVLGPSGCGKSTVLRLIAGLEPHHPPTSGEVLVLGRPVGGPGADRGMVFQDYTSYPNRTELQNVEIGLEVQSLPRKERRELARAWVAKEGLAGHEEKYPHELSGGMRQRVAIARSLVLRPRIILMDEPFGALDPEVRYAMQELLIGLWQEAQATVFFVTHSIPEAAYLGDRLYLMKGSPGRLVEEYKLPRPDAPPLVVETRADFREVVAVLKAKVFGPGGGAAGTAD